MTFGDLDLIHIAHRERAAVGPSGNALSRMSAPNARLLSASPPTTASASPPSLPSAFLRSAMSMPPAQMQQQQSTQAPLGPSLASMRGAASMPGGGGAAVAAAAPVPGFFRTLSKAADQFR
jgi:hypothetical protein